MFTDPYALKAASPPSIYQVKKGIFPGYQPPASASSATVQPSASSTTVQPSASSATVQPSASASTSGSSVQPSTSSSGSQYSSHGNTIIQQDMLNRMAALPIPQDKDKPDVDAKLRPLSGKIYSSLDSATKNALATYTKAGDGYVHINKQLAGKETATSHYTSMAKKMTAAIDQSPLPSDTWLVRGTGYKVLASYAHLTEAEVKSMSAQDWIGKPLDNQAFMSCGSAQSTGFGGTVKMRIFCPKGTKALYAEPFSMCGGGDGKNWDGKSKQSYLSSEFETILQRGTHMVVTDAKVSHGTTYLTVYVDDQVVNPL